jgi:hypothetical protein
MISNDFPAHDCRVWERPYRDHGSIYHGYYSPLLEICTGTHTGDDETP